MLIEIKVIPNSKKNVIVKEGNNYKIYLNAPAQDGKANKALINILSKYFKIRKQCIKILKGEKSRNKIIEIIKS